MKYPFRWLRNPHLWIILLIFAACIILHYPEFLLVSGEPGLISFIGLERHSLERILFLAPIVYAACIFGLRGGLMGLIAAIAGMLPRVFLISRYPKDAFFETIVILAIGALINGWLESRRREIGRREQTILKLETLRRDLQRIGKRFQEIFEKAHDAIWIQDLSGKIIAVNKAWSRVTGYEKEKMIDREVSQFFTPDGIEREREIEQALLSGKDVMQPYEQRIVKKDGTKATIMMTTSLLGDEKTPTFLHITRDITEERKLQKSLRLYAGQISKAYEEERKRIARELHDDTIQTMVAVSRRLDNFISRNTGMKKGVLAPLEAIQKDIDKSLIRIRRFVQYLRPPILEFLGLLPALRELVDQVHNQYGIEVKLKVKSFEQHRGSEEELLIYRIVQEALRNVWKHSGASKAEIRIKSDDTGTSVSVSDNGKGFEIKSESELLTIGKLGLMGMKERALILGGTLKVISSPNRGTEVILSVPGKKCPFFHPP